MESISSKKRFSRNGDQTRERILDAAERLFAERGYSAVSIRDIAAASDSELGSVGYHYKTKELLFTRVLERRSQESAQALRLSLERAQITHGEAITVEQIISAFIEQLLAPLKSMQHGATHYLRLVAQRVPVEGDGKLHSVLAIHYRPVRAKYISALHAALPGTPNSKLDWCFSLFELSIGSALFSSTQQQFAIEDLSQEKLQKFEQHYVQFFSAGFKQIEISYRD